MRSVPFLIVSASASCEKGVSGGEGCGAERRTDSSGSLMRPKGIGHGGCGQLSSLLCTARPMPRAGCFFFCLFSFVLHTRAQRVVVCWLLLDEHNRRGSCRDRALGNQITGLKAGADSCTKLFSPASRRCGILPWFYFIL